MWTTRNKSRSNVNKNNVVIDNDDGSGDDVSALELCPASSASVPKPQCCISVVGMPKTSYWSRYEGDEETGRTHQFVKHHDYDSSTTADGRRTSMSVLSPASLFKAQVKSIESSICKKQEEQEQEERRNGKRDEGRKDNEKGQEKDQKGEKEIWDEKWFREKYRRVHVDVNDDSGEDGDDENSDEPSGAWCIKVRQNLKLQELVKLLFARKIDCFLLLRLTWRTIFTVIIASPKMRIFLLHPNLLIALVMHAQEYIIIIIITSKLAHP